MTHFFFILVSCFCLFGTTPTYADYKAGELADMKGDFETALKEYLVSANEGNAKAQYALGVLYVKGQGVQINHKEGEKWFRRSAEQGYMYAQTALGYMHLKKGGGEAYDNEAIMWLTKSGLQGHPLAQFYLGVIYEKGLGFPPNYEKSLYWFNQAASNDFVPAMNRLGNAYEKGELGLKQSSKIANGWYRKAGR